LAIPADSAGADSAGAGSEGAPDTGKPGESPRVAHRRGLRLGWVVLIVLVLTGLLALAAGLVFHGSGAPPAGQVLAVGTSPAWPQAVDVLAGDASSLPVQESEAEWQALLPKLQEAAKKAPGDAAAQRRLAMAYSNLGTLSEAEKVYLKLLSAGENAVIRNRLGNVYRAEGDVGKAESAYRRALATDPTLPNPYLNLAELLWRQRRDREALAVIVTGLAKVPADSRGLLEQAKATIESAAAAPSSTGASTSPSAPSSTGS
jgi:Flp pilus assembly protein TadD